MGETMLQALCEAVDEAALMRHCAEFAQWMKLAGSYGESASLDYIRGQLDKYGYHTTLLRHDAYISLPGRSQVTIDGQILRSITHSFSCTSPADGLTGELVYVGAGSDADFAGRDLRGAIVLVDGIATPPVTRRASRAGAAGQLHISPHDHLHEMCISPIWGSPSADTRDELPTTVVCSILLADGAALRDRLARGEQPAVVLQAQVDTGWRKTPLLVAELNAPEAEPDSPFVLFSGHHDTWYFGVMDNGSANATMLETARLCARERAGWRRGLRLCFWSGHSHGRYSGSTWYVDNHWVELDQRCVAHINIDSPGAFGADILENVGAMSPFVPLAAEVIKAQSGQTLLGKRESRGADMSFSGVGLPAIFGDLSEPPPTPVGAHCWWWHTPDDLLDKIDPRNMVRDTRIYVHALWRLLSDVVLPLDFCVYADALRDELDRLAAALGDRFSLVPLLEATEALYGHAAALLHVPSAAASRVNHALMSASRALVPIDYTSGDRFVHDPALPLPAWPTLDPLRALAATQPDSDAARYCTVSAVRARNRVEHALRQANAALAIVLD